MKNKVFVIASIIMIFIVAAAAILTYQKTVHNVGKVTAIGVELYTDSTKVTELTQIDWQMIEPNETKTYGFYAFNSGNSPITMTLSTDNWIPLEASQYIVLSWNYANETIDADTGMSLEFSLFVEPNIHMSPNATITDFTFDTTVTAH